MLRHREQILAVRRPGDRLRWRYHLSIYHPDLVSEVSGDIVKTLGRAEISGRAISGLLYDPFGGDERVVEPQLRQPNAEHHARRLRQEPTMTNPNELGSESCSIKPTA